VNSRHPLKYAHFVALRWQHGPDRRAEFSSPVKVSPGTPDEVFMTLVHEAAHGLADARGIQDASRRRRWHNARLAAPADELGLIPNKDDRLGWSPCQLPKSTRDTYAHVIDELLATMSIPPSAGRAPDRRSDIA
jgi:hypothetical protein